jgi:hypothetical protein
VKKQVSTRAGARIITDDGMLIGIVSRCDDRLSYPTTRPTAPGTQPMVLP